MSNSFSYPTYKEVSNENRIDKSLALYYPILYITQMVDVLYPVTPKSRQIVKLKHCGD